MTLQWGSFIITGQCWKSSLGSSVRPFWPYADGKGEKCLVTAGVGESPDISQVSPLTNQGGSWALLLAGGDENPSSLLGLLWHYPICVVGVPPCSLTRMEFKAPHLAFADLGGDWAIVFFCDFWLELSNYCLKVFCFTKLPFSSLFG